MWKICFIIAHHYHLHLIYQNVILIINGKKNELIACYKNENIKYNNEIVVFYKNLKENNGKEIDIKIRLINKINMSNIIKIVC